MAFFMGLRPPTRGVDMFRTIHCASVGTELSNAPAAWTCDSGDTLSDTNLLDSCASRCRILLGGFKSSRKISSQAVPGVILFCDCPRLLPFSTHGIAEGRLAWEGICHLVGDSPELG